MKMEMEIKMEMEMEMETKRETPLPPHTETPTESNLEIVAFPLRESLAHSHRQPSCLHIIIHHVRVLYSARACDL